MKKLTKIFTSLALLSLVITTMVAMTACGGRSNGKQEDKRLGTYYNTVNSSSWVYAKEEHVCDVNDFYNKGVLAIKGHKTGLYLDLTDAKVYIELGDTTSYRGDYSESEYKATFGTSIYKK